MKIFGISFGNGSRQPGHPRYYGANTHPAVRDAYTALLVANEEMDRLASPGAAPGTPEAEAAHAAEYRLYQADKAHHEAWHAASGRPDEWTPDDWLVKYPALEAEMHRDFLQEVEREFAQDAEAHDGIRAHAADQGPSFVDRRPARVQEAEGRARVTGHEVKYAGMRVTSLREEAARIEARRAAGEASPELDEYESDVRENLAGYETRLAGATAQQIEAQAMVDGYAQDQQLRAARLGLVPERLSDRGAWARYREPLPADAQDERQAEADVTRRADRQPSPPQAGSPAESAPDLEAG